MNGTAFRSCYRQLSRLENVMHAAPPSPSLRRFFASSPVSQSRIGAASITVPPEVSLKFYDLPKPTGLNRTRGKEIADVAVEVEGPLGKLRLNVPPFSTLNFDEQMRKASFEIRDVENKHQRSMWGTIRQHFHNCVLGVSEGHICILKLVGVGFRASIEPTAVTVPEPEYPGQQYVSLKVGYAHPIELPIPLGITASTPIPTTILLQATDKQLVSQFAAEIRTWRKPEPYKGKGIFVNGETIKLKAKKIK